MRVTKWGEFGILCSLFLAESQQSSGAENGPSVNATEIAEARSIPLQYTHQILQRLKKGGIIISERGPKGGYRLSRDPKEISLRDVLVAAEGGTFEVVCDSNPVYGESCAANTLCALRGVWGEVKNSVDSVLDSHNLASLIESQRELAQQAPDDAQIVTIASSGNSSTEKSAG